MISRSRRLAAIIFITALWFLPCASAADKPAATKQLRIGMAESMHRGRTLETVKSSMDPFKVLMQTETRRQGELLNFADPLELGKCLASGDVQIGVFLGFEFAWAKQRYPNLQPLALAVNQHRRLRAHLLVLDTSALKDLADLKGKTLAIAEGTKEHCRLYLDRKCQDLGHNSKEYFSEIKIPATIEDALDDVVDGLTQSAVVDGVGLERFKARKPARFAKLREIAKSVDFPATVVAYSPKGSIEAAAIGRIRTALLAVSRTEKGKQMLTLWKLTAFETVPDDFPSQLDEILKTYPPPKQDTK